MFVTNRTRELVVSQIESLKARPEKDAEILEAIERLSVELKTFAAPPEHHPCDPCVSIRRELDEAQTQLAAVSAERDSLGAQVNMQAQEIHELRKQLAAKKKTASKKKKAR